MRITSVQLEDSTMGRVQDISLSSNDMSDGSQEISINIKEQAGYQNVRLSKAAARAVAEVILKMTE